MINIATEIEDEKYKNLLNFCLDHCSRFLFVIRPNINLETRGKRLLKELEPYLIGSEIADRWPGTHLLSTNANIFTYELNVFSVRKLQEYANSLFQWRNPELPEDLCFLDGRNSPILVNIAHEKDSYIETNKSTEAIFKSFFDTIGIRYLLLNRPGLTGDTIT